jgi:hypothetical protein
MGLEFFEHQPGRGASRDAGGESQRVPSGIVELVTIQVKRLKPYLRARSCRAGAKPLVVWLRLGEPREAYSNMRPRHMIIQTSGLTESGLCAQKTPIMGVFCMV